MVQPPEIILDFDALLANFEQLSRIGTLSSEPVALFPVIKANAYGLGAEKVAKKLESHFDKIRMPYLCVARWSEACELRKSGVKRSLLVLSQYTFEELENNTLNDVSLLVSTKGDLEILQKLSESSRKRIGSLHVDFDTGMNRIGYRISEWGDFQKVEELLEKLSMLDIPIAGFSSHLARAEDSFEEFSEQQFERFDEILECVESAWKNYFSAAFPKWIHMNNSAGSCHGKWRQETARRTGIMLWGAYQNSQTKKIFEEKYPSLKIKEVLKMRVALRKTQWIETGEGVSYGHRFVAQRKTLVGLLSVGYADGIRRGLSADQENFKNAKLKFWIDNLSVPLIGTVTMDMIMVDLTDHPKAMDYVKQVARGETVWAHWICSEQPVEAHADVLNTISYEVLCSLSSRVLRSWSSQ